MCEGRGCDASQKMDKNSPVSETIKSLTTTALKEKYIIKTIRKRREKLNFFLEEVTKLKGTLFSHTNF